MKQIYQLSPAQMEQLQGLYQKEWWSTGRTLEETRSVVKHSQIVIGLEDIDGQLNGFARVLTDYIFKALIFDLIVSEENRKKGLGEKLMRAILDHPDLQKVKHFELYCLPEMIPFYEKFLFTTDTGKIRLMRYVTRS